MKFSASFALFGISAFAALAPNHAAEVSVIDSSENNNNSKNDSKNDAVPSMPSMVFASSIANLLDPSGGTNLSLLGLLDPSKPLSEAEATFLEATVRDAFNKFHEDMGIDLIANSVTVGSDESTVADHKDKDNGASSSSSSRSSNLRGASRNLERNIYGTPQPDIRPCTHTSGPLEGYPIEDCEWNIEIFLDYQCWMCIDDDYEIGVVAWRDWTSAPYYDFFRFPDDDDDLKWDSVNGGYVTEKPTENPTAKLTAKPTAKPTAAPSSTPSAAPTEEEDEDSSIDLEEERGPREPTAKPTAAPSSTPSAAPTEEEDEDSSIDLEEERGPGEPDIYRPHPPTPNNRRRRLNNNGPSKPNPIDSEILKKLQQSPFHRYHQLRNVRFGRGY